MTRPIRNALAVTATGLSTLAITSAAYAQTMAPSATPPAQSTSQVPDIVVTAQRRSENAQNVPVAITSLSGAALSKGGVIDTTDLKQVTPGLEYNTNLGGFGQPRIRGIGSTATGPGIENPVATYVDGVYLGSSNGAIMSLSDIQQVDVLKGPQGTLFGRNATGGVIQVTTRAPSQDLHAEGNVFYGNDKTWGGNGYLTGGLTSTLSAAIAGTYSAQDKGYGTDLATGQQVDKQKSGAARAKLLWEPDADTHISLSADYAETKGSQPALHSVSDLFGTASANPGTPWDTDGDVLPYLHTQTGGASLTVKHSFGSVDFTSISAYRNAFFHTTIDGDQTPAPLLTVDIVQKEKQFSQELQLGSHNPGALIWVAGLYYFRYSGIWDPNSTTGPFVCPYGSPANESCASAINAKAKLDSYAAFGQATYAINHATHLTLGLRYTLDQRSLTQSETYNGFPAGMQSASRDFPKLTWRAALDHRFSAELMAYATYNRGFKSGTFQAGTNPIQPLQVETVDAFEGGVKADVFDRKVRVNISGFYYNYTHLQANQIIYGTQEVYDAPGSINYGIDSDITIRPTHDLQINGGISWLHARYKNGFTGAFGNVSPGVPTAGVTIVTIDASGNHLQDTPDFTANVGASYDIETAGSGKFTVSVNYYHNGGYYGDVQNVLKQKAYGLLDASLTWTAPGGMFTVKGWGKNLTNTAYADQYDMTNFANNIVVGPPRTYGVSLGVKY